MPFLLRIHEDWHQALANCLPDIEGSVLEICTFTDARAFLEEARGAFAGWCNRDARALVSPWLCLIYTRLHHEPFETEVCDWPRHSSKGSLPRANGARPYMVFKRDEAIFAIEFQDLEVSTVDTFMPFRYLTSAGASNAYFAFPRLAAVGTMAEAAPELLGDVRSVGGY